MRWSGFDFGKANEQLVFDHTFCLTLVYKFLLFTGCFSSQKFLFTFEVLLSHLAAKSVSLPPVPVAASPYFLRIEKAFAFSHRCSFLRQSMRADANRRLPFSFSSHLLLALSCS